VVSCFAVSPSSANDLDLIDRGVTRLFKNYIIFAIFNVDAFFFTTTTITNTKPSFLLLFSEDML
jgi:hypothetical protein